MVQINFHNLLKTYSSSSPWTLYTWKIKSNRDILVRDSSAIHSVERAKEQLYGSYLASSKVDLKFLA